jgi:hypothetical protein
LLNNAKVGVHEWYEPVARQWLEAQFRSTGERRLMVDGTKLGFQPQLVIVGLA